MENNLADHIDVMPNIHPAFMPLKKAEIVASKTSLSPPTEPEEDTTEEEQKPAAAKKGDSLIAKLKANKIIIIIILVCVIIIIGVIVIVVWMPEKDEVSPVKKKFPANQTQPAPQQPPIPSNNQQQQPNNSSQDNNNQQPTQNNNQQQSQNNNQQSTQNNNQQSTQNNNQQQTQNNKPQSARVSPQTKPTDNLSVTMLTHEELQQQVSKEELDRMLSTQPRQQDVLSEQMNMNKHPNPFSARPDTEPTLFTATVLFPHVDTTITDDYFVAPPKEIASSITEIDGEENNKEEEEESDDDQETQSEVKQVETECGVLQQNNTRCTKPGKFGGRCGIHSRK